MNYLLIVILIALIIWTFGIGFNLGFWVNLFLVVALIAFIIYVLDRRKG